MKKLAILAVLLASVYSLGQAIPPQTKIAIYSNNVNIGTLFGSGNILNIPTGCSLTSAKRIDCNFTANSVTWRGVWAGGTSYSVGDGVGFSGVSYIAIATSTGVTPGTDNTKWVTSGNVGPTGATGSTGATGATGAAGAKGDTGSTGATGAAGATGATGPAGANGTNGTNGTNGQGVPTGGTTNQILSKNSNTDYDTHWVNNTGGTGITNTAPNLHLTESDGTNIIDSGIVRSTNDYGFPGAVNATGAVTAGTPPAGIASTATGGFGATEGTSTGWTPTASTSWMRFDSTAHAAKCSLNGGTETACNPLIAGDFGGTPASPQVVATHLSSPLPVNQGGSGLATRTAHAVQVGAGTSNVVQVGPDASSTKFLASAGSSSDPAFRVIATTDLPATSDIRSVGCGMGSPTGSALTTSETCYVVVPYACTIAGYNILVDAGTATIKTWRKATGTAIPTVSDSISTSGVAISTGTALHSTTVSDWTSTAVSANDIIAFNLSAVATAKFVYFSVQCNQ